MKNKVLYTLVFILVLVMATSTYTNRKTALAESSVPGYEVISHRGFEDQFPENTIYSAKKALKYNTPVEFDIQFTKDGEMVIMHDDSVDRTTNGTGLVRELEAPYIKGLDAGAKFSKKYKGIEVPSFEEYLDAVEGMSHIYPELKSYRNDDDIRRFTGVLIDRGFEYRATILSFGYADTLPIIRSQSSDIRVGALAGVQKDFERYLDIAKRDSSSVMVISKKIATKENLERCRKENISVIVWTVRSENEARELSKIGYTRFISSRYFQLD